MRHFLIIIVFLLVSVSYGQDIVTFTEVYSQQGYGDFNTESEKWEFDTPTERKVLIVFNYDGNRDIKIIMPDGNFSMLYNWTKIKYIEKAGDQKAFVLDAYFNGHLVRGILFEDEFRVIIDSFTMLRWIR